MERRGTHCEENGDTKSEIRRNTEKVAPATPEVHQVRSSSMGDLVKGPVCTPDLVPLQSRSLVTAPKVGQLPSNLLTPDNLMNISSREEWYSETLSSEHNWTQISDDQYGLEEWPVPDEEIFTKWRRNLQQLMVTRLGLPEGNATRQQELPGRQIVGELTKRLDLIPGIVIHTVHDCSVGDKVCCNSSSTASVQGDLEQEGSEISSKVFSARLMNCGSDSKPAGGLRGEDRNSSRGSGPQEFSELPWGDSNNQFGTRSLDYRRTTPLCANEHTLSDSNADQGDLGTGRCRSQYCEHERGTFFRDVLQVSSLPDINQPEISNCGAMIELPYSPVVDSTRFLTWYDWNMNPGLDNHEAYTDSSAQEISQENDRESFLSSERLSAVGDGVTGKCQALQPRPGCALRIQDAVKECSKYLLAICSAREEYYATALLEDWENMSLDQNSTIKGFNYVELEQNWDDLICASEGTQIDSSYGEVPRPESSDLKILQGFNVRDGDLYEEETESESDPLAIFQISLLSNSRSEVVLKEVDGPCEGPPCEELLHYWDSPIIAKQNVPHCRSTLDEYDWPRSEMRNVEGLAYAPISNLGCEPGNDSDCSYNDIGFRIVQRPNTYIDIYSGFDLFEGIIITDNLWDSV